MYVVPSDDVLAVSVIPLSSPEKSDSAFSPYEDSVPDCGELLTVSPEFGAAALLLLLLFVLPVTELETEPFAAE